MKKNNQGPGPNYSTYGISSTAAYFINIVRMFQQKENKNIKRAELNCAMQAQQFSNKPSNF